VFTVWFFSKEEPIPAPQIPVSVKKEQFKKVVAPAVSEVYAELTTQYQEVLAASKSGSDMDEFERLKRTYRVSTTEELLVALKPHPKSIAMAQAAIESNWATSRFSVEANNLFGVWSFDENEPRIAAGKKRGDKTIWVKKYASIKESIRDYYRLLARGSAFSEFRQLKMKTSDPYLLVKKLDRYSEQGDEYGITLASVIRHNHFDAYDEKK